VDQALDSRAGCFLPVCSYSNPLRSRVGATHAVGLLASRFSKVAIVVADELQRINIQLRGSSVTDALKNSTIAGANTTRMYHTVIRGKSLANVEVIELSKLRRRAEFQNVEARVLTALYSVERFRKETERFVSRASRRFGWRDSAGARQLETEYLNLEIITSVFMSELAGYPFEIWEDLPPASDPDPLTVAYTSAASELSEALGKQVLERRLLALASLEG
jgi:hypothetical protein